MAMSFSGEFNAPRSPEEVFDFLTDPNLFAPLLPDFQALEVQDARNFTVRLSVGVAHIRGTAEVKMRLKDADRPRRAEYSGQGSLAGNGLGVVARFELSAENGGTRVAWNGESQVMGRLAAMAGGLLEPLARRNLEKLIEGLRRALTAPAAP